MVNGHLLAVMSRGSFSEKCAVTVSTIAALMKEFNLDWTDEGLVSASLEQKRAAIAELGFYCQVPVKTFNELMRKLIKYGRRRKVDALGGFIRNFLKLYNPSESQLLLLSSYLFTALKAVRMSKPSFSTPFMVDIDSRGRVWFCYYYRSSKTKKTHVERHSLGCRFPRLVGAASPSMSELFSDMFNPK
jgi:uncharacterized protein YcgL (UPF0745 family)